MSAVALHPINPILGNLLLTLDGSSRVILEATDLALRIRAFLVTNQAEGQVKALIPAKRFYEIVKNLDDDATITVTFEEKGHHQLVCGKHRYKLPVVDPTGFPEEPSWVWDSTLIVREGGQGLISAMEKVKHAMAKGDVRRVLNGMLLETTLGRINLVATDGHRLAGDGVLAEVEGNPMRVVLPRELVEELVKTIVRDNDLQIWMRPDVVAFAQPNMEVYSRLISEVYPEYQKAIPVMNGNIQTAIVNRELLLRAVKSAMALAGTEHKAVQLQFDLGVVRVSSVDRQVGEALIEVPAECSHSKNWGANGKYLREVLEVLESEDVFLRTGDSRDGLWIVGEDSEVDHSMQYVMPVRL